MSPYVAAVSKALAQGDCELLNYQWRRLYIAFSSRGEDTRCSHDRSSPQALRIELLLEFQVHHSIHPSQSNDPAMVEMKKDEDQSGNEYGIRVLTLFFSPWNDSQAFPASDPEEP